VANPREKNEVDKNENEGGMMNGTALPRLFPGMNREREMSAMVSALTHVVTGEVPTTTDSVTPDVPSSASTTPSLPSSSNYILASSSSKRTREQDTPCFSQASSVPRSKHRLQIFTIYVTFFNFL